MALAVLKIAGAQCPIAAGKIDESSSDQAVGYSTTRFEDEQRDKPASASIVRFSTHAAWHVDCKSQVAPAESVDEGRMWLLPSDQRTSPGAPDQPLAKTPGSTEMTLHSAADGSEEIPTESTNQPDRPRNEASGSYCEFLAATFLVDLSSRHDEEPLIYDPMVNQVKLIEEQLIAVANPDQTSAHSSPADVTSDVASREADNDANSPSPS